MEPVRQLVAGICLDSNRPTVISQPNKNPGPSGEDADKVGKPRDVG